MADPVPQVITEIVGGDALTLTQAAALIPGHRGSGTASPSRLSRWTTTGQKRADGVVVKLESAKFGIQVLTSRAALERFSAALTAPSAEAVATDGAAPTRTPSARQKAGEAAAKRLSQAGA